MGVKGGGGSLSKLTINFFWGYQKSWYLFLDTVRIGLEISVELIIVFILF